MRFVVSARSQTLWVLDMDIGTLDFETDPFLAGRIPFPFTCGIYFSPDRYSILWGKNVIEDTVKELHKLPVCVLYTHNGGKFDFFYLLEYADSGKCMVRNGRIIEMQIGKVILRDSWPLIPFALEEYKKSYPEEYYKTNDESEKIKILRKFYSIFEENKREEVQNKLRIQKYLYDDCKNLHELVTGFKEILGPKDTIGSAAFFQMRKYGIKISSLNESHDNIFRPYFFGGRVEAFKQGVFHGKFCYLDVNSAYSFAMLYSHAHGNDYANRKTLPKRSNEIGKCFITADADSSGAFPLRDIDGSLNFPCGRNKYLITGWEFIAALETGTAKIHKVLEVWKPSNTISFENFVLPFYEKRMQAKKDGDRIAYLAYKYLLNSGYGKFAQNPRDFREYLLEKFGVYPNDKKEWEWETDYGDISLWSRPNYDGYGFYDVATGASITGFQRAKLWTAICKSRDVLYADTDAVLCSRSNVTRGKKLGLWKIEGIADEVCIAGKKLYCLRGKDFKKISSKGARLTYAEIKSLCDGKTITWDNPAPTFSATSGAHFVKRRIKST